IPQVPHTFGSRLVVGANFTLYLQSGWLLVRDALRGADVVHSVGASFAGILGGHWARRARVPHVMQAIGSDINSILPNVQTWPVIRGWERRCDAIVCNSRALARTVGASFPNAPQAEVVYRGTDLQTFTPVPRTQANGVRFVFLGGFPDYPELPARRNTKGGETLSRAWAERERELHALGATLSLGGPASDTPAVRAWRDALAFPGSVTIEGIVPPQSVADAMRDADVVLVPSLEEGLPNIAVEAAACGVPVFGSDVGGIPEIVRHGETGLVLPPGDVRAWGDALVAYAARGAELAAMGERARAHAETSFDAREYGTRMTTIYERVATRLMQTGDNRSCVESQA
ncbi:MAG TPA: glycosyltransferase family 4 protein, partial [Thermoanaerobaculia bacterium]|nr:glycosyltransferase family 4 protein [Thermoanaerobaculia bacterium]